MTSKLKFTGRIKCTSNSLTNLACRYSSELHYQHLNIQIMIQHVVLWYSKRLIRISWPTLPLREEEWTWFTKYKAGKNQGTWQTQIEVTQRVSNTSVENIPPYWLSLQTKESYKCNISGEEWKYCWSLNIQ